jgi:pimeloyl-ACP methyl ester carboxylesterase
VGFVIALSPPGVALHEIDLYQSNQRLERAGVRGAELAEANQLLVDLHAAARGEFQDPPALAERLQRGRARPWASVLDLPGEVPPRGAAGALLRWSASDLDPAEFFGRLRRPVLLVFGGRDERLPAERCLERLRERLAGSGQVELSVLLYPEANHALMPAPDLESDLTAWIRAHAWPEKR